MMMMVSSNTPSPRTRPRGPHKNKHKHIEQTNQQQAHSRPSVLGCPRNHWLGRPANSPLSICLWLRHWDCDARNRGRAKHTHKDNTNKHIITTYDKEVQRIIQITLKHINIRHTNTTIHIIATNETARTLGCPCSSRTRTAPASSGRRLYSYWYYC